jgi:hypothetical protein
MHRLCKGIVAPRRVVGQEFDARCQACRVTRQLLCHFLVDCESMESCDDLGIKLHQTGRPRDAVCDQPYDDREETAFDPASHGAGAELWIGESEILIALIIIVAAVIFSYGRRWTIRRTPG